MNTGNNYARDRAGQFKKRSKFKVFLNWLIFIGIIAIIIVAGYNAYKIKHEATDVSTPTVQAKPADPLSTIESTASFQEQMKLQAETIEVNQERDAENARHASAITAIEAQASQIRSEQLANSEAGTPTTSLK